MTKQFNPPPGWPDAPPGWQPPTGWRPDPSWPAAPAGWQLWVDDPTSPTGAPRRHGWLLILPIGVVTYILVLTTMSQTQNLNLFPSLLLVGSLTVPLAVLMLAYDTVEHAPGSGTLIGLTAVGGGFAGVIAGSYFEYTTLKQLPWLGMLGVGVIEETAKLIVPVLVLLVVGVRSHGLGVVLGIASGAGFAVLETMGYGFSALLASQGNLDVVDRTLLLRALLSPACHVAWTGMVCFALWRLLDQPRPRFAVPGVIGAWLFAVALHTAWDATGSLWLHIGVATISVVGLVAIIRRSRT